MGKKGEITARDLEIVRWLGRQKLATAEQVMRRFGMHRAKAYRRLGLLVANGLVRFEPGVRSRRVYLARPRGLREVDLDVTPATVSAASFAHDLAVVDVAIVYERDPRLRVLTEREIRRADRAQHTASYALRPMLADSTPNAGRWPDLVIEHPASGTRRAIEVELTRKKDARLHDKLLAYIGSDYESVTYLVPTATALRHVVRQVNRLGLNAMVKVELLPAFTAQAERMTSPSLDDLHAEAAQLRSTITQLQTKVTMSAEQLKERESQIHDLERKLTWLLGQVTGYIDAGHFERAETRKRWRAEITRPRASAGARQ